MLPLEPFWIISLSQISALLVPILIQLYPTCQNSTRVPITKPIKCEQDPPWMNCWYIHYCPMIIDHQHMGCTKKRDMMEKVMIPRWNKENPFWGSRGQYDTCRPQSNFPFNFLILPTFMIAPFMPAILAHSLLIWHFLKNHTQSACNATKTGGQILKW